jgi:indole-3-glycerol phosphate synthase
MRSSLPAKLSTAARPANNWNDSWNYRQNNYRSDILILEEIAAKTRIRVDAAKQTLPFDTVRALARPGGNGFPFERALAQAGLSFICEVKKASPSKGIIAGDFPYLQIAREYEDAGAAAISVLTEPEYFLGSDAYLREIAQTVTVPILRKDFIVDSYQVYESSLLGASAILLICAILDTDTVREYIRIADSLGLSALVEVHSALEVESALNAGARIIGINNRDLKTFTVDLETTSRLRKLIPAGIITVSESGIRSVEDIRALEAVDAVLVGETLMRSPDRKQYLCALKEAAAGTVHED